MIRRPALLVPLAALVASLAFAPAASAKSCRLSPSEQRGLGATYVFKLRATGVTCGKAKKVVKAFNACRKANGGADGRCNRRVLRFRCSESRFNRISTQYDSNVVCKRGAKRVTFTYQQNT